MRTNGFLRAAGQRNRRCLLMLFIACSLVVLSFSAAGAVPVLDKTKYHTWKEVNRYLKKIARDPALRKIVSLITIGYTTEGRPLRVLRISRKGIIGSHPDIKPATFIMGAHHAREHVSKEAVLALIDKLINGYGRNDDEGLAITYLVDAGTFYLLPWVNPDGGMNQFLHNPEQRKTNRGSNEPQIGAAGCATCGDDEDDEDSPDLIDGDVGVVSNSGFEVAFANNKVISRHLQLWYEKGDYSQYVVDDRASWVQPGFSPYTFNYEGIDPDGDGLFAPYSGEDFVGGTDPNRNYGGPEWGDCENDEGCSFLSGAQTYAGPVPFSEPETAAVAAFIRSHANIVTLESLHSGINEIYPPWFINPDTGDKSSMDMSYHDSVAQYISRETGYEVVYGGGYAVKGDTTSYAYVGSSQDPDMGLDFYPGGLLSFTTEIYGMGSDSGSGEAVKDWFPKHYEQFNTDYPQGTFITWSDFPMCTTCGPDAMAGGLPWYYYTQYTEYFVFDSVDVCGGENAPGIFHCDYWGVQENNSYYADHDIFAYFNPPATNRCYEDWNCDGSALVRTLDRQLKHLMYRLYIAPYLMVDLASTSGDRTTLEIGIKNTGFLRSSVMTAARQGEDPMQARYNDFGRVDVKISKAIGFRVNGPRKVNIGWLGGGRNDDPEPKTKTAGFSVSGLSAGDIFVIKAGSEKTGKVFALMQVVKSKKNHGLSFRVVWTNHVPRSETVDHYFTGGDEKMFRLGPSMMRATNQIQTDMQKAQQRRLEWKRMDGPFDLVPGHAKGIIMRKYHD